MYYFLNTMFNDKKSGIEHAQMKRLALFRDHQTQAEIVLANFSLNFHETLAKIQLRDADVVNLYDFFQGTEHVQPKKFEVEDYIPAKDVQITFNQATKTYEGRKDKQLVLMIYCRTNSTQIDHINYFDEKENMVKADWYDSRGFLSLEQFYNLNGQTISEQLFDLNGKVVYQTFHFPDRQNKTQNSLYRILNYQGQDWTFFGQKSLIAFFLDCLNSRNAQENTFIVDRTWELAWATLHMKTKANRVFYLHSNHVNNPKDSEHSPLNYNYALALNNLSLWDAILVPTKDQAREIAERYGTKVPVVSIPVGVVSDELLNRPHVPFEDRVKDQVVMVARLSEEKQQNQLVTAFKTIHQAIPAATLEFWGYANGKTGDELKKQVADLKLESVISFHDYTQDIGAVYDKAQLAVLTSRAEGFSLALLEAQSHGVPQVAYDIKYGPRDILVDGQDGLLVPLNDIEQLAQTIIELLNDQPKLKQFSENAYQDSKRYSEDAVWMQWEELFDVLKQEDQG